MRTFYILFIILFIFTGFTTAQSESEIRPTQHFDFWVGSWELTYEQSDGTEAKATNKIERILSGTTLQENFEVISGQNKNYAGKSWSVYDQRAKKWHQTWVDNQGAYLTFIGQKEGSKRFFSRTSTNAEGVKIIQRMVFYDIERNSFTWDWEQSEDDGQNWTLLWRINYKRKQ